jgi:tRNA-2-methylthio-N6-dimethylallyladenosine synthase
MYDCVDLDAIDLGMGPPNLEPQRQYYFMAKLRETVYQERKRLGRPITACVVTFGCQMHLKSEIA